MRRNPCSARLCVPTPRSLVSIYAAAPRACSRRGGGCWPPLSLHRAQKGLDGSLVVGAVVAPAQAHTVLLLAQHVGCLIGHGDGYGGGGACGAGRGGNDGRGFHAIVELRQREFYLCELAVRRLGGLVHPRRHHCILVLLARYLGNGEDRVRYLNRLFFMET